MIMVSRVHWLLWHLSPSFKSAYTLICDYRYHSYFFYRFEYGRSRPRSCVRECFSVVRTSKRCFRLIYVNCRSSAVFYRSFSKSSDTADFMENVYRYGFESSEWSHPP